MTYGTKTQQKDREQFDWLQSILFQNTTGSTTKKMLRLIQPCFGKKNETGVHLTPKDNFVEMASLQRNPD